ncbi:MAG TPA: hypothetical protein VGE26_08965, partial [Sphingobacteriaceae bacterium]
PVVLINAGTLLPRKDPYFRIKPGRVTAVFAGLVEVEGLTLEDLPAVKNRVHREMELLIIANSELTENRFVI